MKLLLSFLFCLGITLAQDSNIIPHGTQHKSTGYDAVTTTLVSTDYDWSQDPGGALSAGANTITLTPCPLGISGTNSNHNVFIDNTGAGTDESVAITGGTCTTGAPTGTLIFTTAGAHSSTEWTIGSGTAGIVEAHWTFDISGNGNPDGGVIRIPTGQHLIKSTIVLGNGTSSVSSSVCCSDLNYIQIKGSGPGEDGGNASSNFTTELKWAGAVNGQVVLIQGQVRGIGISNLRIHGGNTSGDILTLLDAKFGSFNNLVIGHSNTGFYGMRLKNGSNGNRFNDLRVIQQCIDCSAVGVGNEPNVASVGNPQNSFVGFKFLFAGNDSTSVGLKLEAADSNGFLQGTVSGNLVTVTDCTNASPIVITTNVTHERDTGDSVIISAVTGNTACNGTFTITDLTTTTFSLDSSTGNGAYVSGGFVVGPGKALRFEQFGTIFPQENSFYNISFIRGLVDSDGGHRCNWFFPYPTTDQEFIPQQSSATAFEFCGFAYADFNDTETVDNFPIWMGPLERVKSDASSWMRYFPALEALAIGDVEGFKNDALDKLVVRSISENSVIEAQTQTSGDAILSLQNVGNQGYFVRADRAGNVLEIGSNALGVFLTLLAADGTAFFQNATDTTSSFRILAANGDTVFNCDTSNGRCSVGVTAPLVTFEVAGAIGIGGGGTALASLGTPADGTVDYCSDCLKGSDPCTASSTGAMAMRVNGAWQCP